ncbi:MAG: class I SAM-dependent methyltransferase [Planctomycetes bacterium]|nr:class I SAM-dependent methyltransferase [Planctomycetota bacterium]
MTAGLALPASFRDPSGRVFLRDGRIFRTVTRRAAADFQRVVETGLLEELAREDLLVPWRQVPLADAAPVDGNVVKVLEHDRLDFISYPYEWSFAGLKAAAILHLDIQLRALSKGITLSDASAYNVQFVGPRPVFIDHLSFRPYREGEFWRGHRQFCDQFLNPLLLRAWLGIPHNAWYRGAMEGIPAVAVAATLPWRAWLAPRIATHVMFPAWFERLALRSSNSAVSRKVSKTKLPRRSFERMLRSLRSWIAGLRPKGAAKTVWSDYAASNTYTGAEAQKKRVFVARFAERVKPALLWDIGCNTGEYAQVALEAGAALAIGFEYDPGALERAFHRAESRDLRFLPLYLDAANPSPSQGWNQAERDGLAARGPAPGLLALAVVHHLCVGRNIPLADAVAWLVGQAHQGVIEFVPKKDSMVQALLSFREDIFDDYCDESFDCALSMVAKVVHSETITESGRRLVWYERPCASARSH